MCPHAAEVISSCCFCLSRIVVLASLRSLGLALFGAEATIVVPFFMRSKMVRPRSAIHNCKGSMP